MPSPFPGMDPYLEDPYVWPDFHNSLASEIRNQLNRHLPPPYFAQLEMREELGIVGERNRRVIIPDVGIAHGHGTSRPKNEGVVAVLDEPRTEISPSMTILIEHEQVQVASIEIRDSKHGRKLVTLIEIISPSNKQPGEDHQKYLQKRDRIISSDTSLVEIDLRREGEIVCIEPSAWDELLSQTQRPDYLAIVNRAWERKAHIHGPHQVFPIRLTEPLPVIPIPLRENEKETPLDLQHAFQTAYDGGPYNRGGVDYSQPPTPPLPQELCDWAAERIRQAFAP